MHKREELLYRILKIIYNHDSMKEDKGWKDENDFLLKIKNA